MAIRGTCISRIYTVILLELFVNIVELVSRYPPPFPDTYFFEGTTLVNVSDFVS